MRRPAGAAAEPLPMRLGAGARRAAPGLGNQTMQQARAGARTPEIPHWLDAATTSTLRAHLEPSNPAREAEADRLGAGPAPVGGAAAEHAAPGLVPSSGGRPLGGLQGPVRLHTGPEAAAMAAAVGARAYTVGCDIVFGAERPGTAPGDALLRHELGHVHQQQTEGRVRLDRYPDPRGPSMGESLIVSGPYTSGAIALDGGERVTALAPASDGFVQVELPPPYLHAGEPFSIPVGLVEPESGPGAGGVFAAGGLFPPVELGPADLFPDMPEGVVIEIPADQLPPEMVYRAALGSTAQPQGGGWALAGGAVSWTGRAAHGGVTRHVMQYGFDAAGSHAVGMVGYPNVLSARALRNLDVPQSPILFGHTILYIRIDGKIHTMTSFGPESLMAAGADAWRGTNAGVPGQIIQHLEPQNFPLSVSGTHGFPNTSAISVEWPVDAQLARGLSQQMSGAEAEMMMRYAAYMEQCPVGQNCVAWALDQLEGAMGGQVGQAGGVPLRDMSGEGTARQGRFQQIAEEALEFQESGGARGTPLADMPNATGPARVGRMGTGLKIIKWGGHIFEVGGYALSIYNIATASEAERPFAIAEEGITTVAGPAGLVMTEFYLQPMREVAAGRGDATMLILPVPYIAPIVRVLEPEKQDPEGGRLIRRAVLDNDPGAAMSVIYRLFGGY